MRFEAYRGGTARIPGAAVRPRRLAPVLRDPCLWAGVALLAAVLAVVTFGGWLAPYDPHALSGRPLERPGAAHPLGTNDIGQDLFSQLLHGGRTSLLIGVSAATLSTALAWGLGLLSGLGPRWHAAVGALADLFLALPFLPLAILIVAHLGPGRAVIALTLGLISWPAFARVARASPPSWRSATWRPPARPARGPRGSCCAMCSPPRCRWPRPSSC